MLSVSKDCRQEGGRLLHRWWQQEMDHEWSSTLISILTHQLYQSRLVYVVLRHFESSMFASVSFSLASHAFHLSHHGHYCHLRFSPTTLPARSALVGQSRPKCSATRVHIEHHRTIANQKSTSQKLKNLNMSERQSLQSFHDRILWSSLNMFELTLPRECAVFQCFFWRRGPGPSELLDAWSNDTCSGFIMFHSHQSCSDELGQVYAREDHH